MMKRITHVLAGLLKVALSAVATVAVFLAISHVLAPKNNQEAFGQHDERAHGVAGEPAGSIDVLFLGDSEIYTSVSPLQLWDERGVTSYVLGTAAQKLPYTRSLLAGALEGQDPRVVVLETNCLFRPFTTGEALLRAGSDALPAIEYHDRWKSLTVQDLVAPVRATWTDEEKGFAPGRGTRAADASGHMAPSDKVAALPRLNRLYLEEIKRMCDREGARLVLLSTPSTRNWSTARHNGVERAARELGLDYVDLNVGDDLVEIDWATDSYDAGDHLNVSGARKVTTAVGSLLAGRYDAPDHRGDDAYDAWAEASARSRGRR